MSGCLQRIGCLTVLAVAGVASWMTRDLWWERVTGQSNADTRVWESGIPDSSVQIRPSRKDTGAFVALSAAEVATLLRKATTELPIPVRDPEVAIDGDRVSVRGRVSFSEVALARELGPLASVLRGDQMVTISGRPRVEGKGRGVVAIAEVRVGGAQIPGPAVRAVLAQLGGRPGEGTSGEPSISFSLPPTVSDIRVARGQVVIYRNVP